MKRIAVALTMAALPLASLFIRAQTAACDLTAYHAQPGLAAVNGADGLTVSWTGETDRELRLRLGIDACQPFEIWRSVAKVLAGQRWRRTPVRNSALSPASAG